MQNWSATDCTFIAVHFVLKLSVFYHNELNSEFNKDLNYCDSRNIFVSLFSLTGLSKH